VEPFGNHAGFRLAVPALSKTTAARSTPRACTPASRTAATCLSELLAGHLTLAEGQALVAGARELLADPALLPGQPFEAMRLAAHQAEAARQLLPHPRSAGHPLPPNWP